MAQPIAPSSVVLDDVRTTASLGQAARATVSLQAMLRATSSAGSVGRVASPRNASLGRPQPVAAPSGVTRTPSAAQRRADQVVNFALRQQGKPYVFGTSGPDTFDCSGLVTSAYRQVGLDVPAYTFTQATLGRAVDASREQIQPGDLIFTRGGSPPRDLGHVGIAVSSTEWVRAPRTGDVVKAGPLPLDGIQLVRRLVEQDPKAA